MNKVGKYWVQRAVAAMIWVVFAVSGVAQGATPEERALFFRPSHQKVIVWFRTRGGTRQVATLVPSKSGTWLTKEDPDEIGWTNFRGQTLKFISNDSFVKSLGTDKRFQEVSLAGTFLIGQEPPNLGATRMLKSISFVTRENESFQTTMAKEASGWTLSQPGSDPAMDSAAKAVGLTSDRLLQVLDPRPGPAKVHRDRIAEKFFSYNTIQYLLFPDAGKVIMVDPNLGLDESEEEDASQGPYAGPDGYEKNQKDSNDRLTLGIYIAGGLASLVILFLGGRALLAGIRERKDRAMVQRYVQARQEPTAQKPRQAEAVPYDNDPDVNAWNQSGFTAGPVSRPETLPVAAVVAASEIEPLGKPDREPEVVRAEDVPVGRESSDQTTDTDWDPYQDPTYLHALHVLATIRQFMWHDDMITARTEVDYLKEYWVKLREQHNQLVDLQQASEGQSELPPKENEP
ncbi:MAG: hypothetical protein JST40_07180 [Armatimonadetes bacterium]|nr:hypothetical protein [Armatimonadota bacterium]